MPLQEIFRPLPERALRRAISRRGRACGRGGRRPHRRPHVYSVRRRGPGRGRDLPDPKNLRHTASLPSSGRSVGGTSTPQGRAAARNGQQPNDSGVPGAPRSLRSIPSRARVGAAHTEAVEVRFRCKSKPARMPEPPTPPKERARKPNRFSPVSPFDVGPGTTFQLGPSAPDHSNFTIPLGT